MSRWREGIAEPGDVAGGGVGGEALGEAMEAIVLEGGDQTVGERDLLQVAGRMVAVRSRERQRRRAGVGDVAKPVQGVVVVADADAVGMSRAQSDQVAGRIVIVLEREGMAEPGGLPGFGGAPVGGIVFEAGDARGIGHGGAASGGIIGIGDGGHAKVGVGDLLEEPVERVMGEAGGAPVEVGVGDEVAGEIVSERFGLAAREGSLGEAPGRIVLVLGDAAGGVRLAGAAPESIVDEPGDVAGRVDDGGEQAFVVVPKRVIDPA